MIGLSYRPGGPDWRLDIAYVANDGSGNVYHGWSAGAGSKVEGVENLGGIADPRFGAQCTWDYAGNALTLQCVGANGSIYQMVMFIDGTHGPWVELTDSAGKPLTPAPPPAGPAGATGPAGPVGPSYDDTALRAQVATAEGDAQSALTKLNAVKAAL